MFGLFGKKEKKEIDMNIYAPVNGTCIPLDQVKDKVFASKMMGDGVGFQYEGDTVYAPMDGKIMMVANTKHAVGMMGDNGVEVLIHVGLDTVNLNGQGLEVLVKQNQSVKKGTAMIKIDRGFMKEKEIDLTTPMVITNGADYTISKLHEGEAVTTGDCVIISEKK